MDFVRRAGLRARLERPREQTRRAIHYSCGVDPHIVQTYTETYAKFDPMASLPRFGQIVSIPDLVSYDEYRQGRFYQEWLRPQGWADAAIVMLEK